jgi:hypothetical protein
MNARLPGLTRRVSSRPSGLVWSRVTGPAAALFRLLVAVAALVLVAIGLLRPSDQVVIVA